MEGHRGRPDQTTTLSRASYGSKIGLALCGSSIRKPARSMAKSTRPNAAATVMPGLYNLRFGKAEWPFVKIDGGKTLTLKAAVVKLERSIKWQKRARVVTRTATRLFRFDAVSYQAALPPASTSSRSMTGRSRSMPPRVKCST